MSYSQASRSQYEASQHANSFIDSDLPQSDESLDALSSQSIAQSTPVSDTPLPLNILVPRLTTARRQTLSTILYSLQLRQNRSNDGDISDTVFEMVAND
ncbi:unnamed protein product [Penicillium nalgiovense]|nr:unnamed protein product [Penicillium nalgiovense]